MPPEIKPELKKIVEQLFIDPETLATDFPTQPFHPIYITNNFVQQTLSRLLAYNRTSKRWYPLLVDDQGRLVISSIATGVSATMKVYDGTNWQNLRGTTDGYVLSAILAYDGSSYQNLRVESNSYPNLRTAIFQEGRVVAVIPNSVDGRSVTANGLTTASFLYGFNGSSWDRLRVDSDKNLLTQAKAVVATTDPSYSDGDIVPLRVDNTGKLYITGDITVTPQATTSAYQSFTDPSSYPELSLDTGNRLQCEIWAKSLSGGATVKVYGSTNGTNWRLTDTLTTDSSTAEISQGYFLGYQYIKVVIEETGTGTAEIEISAK